MCKAVYCTVYGVMFVLSYCFILVCVKCVHLDICVYGVFFVYLGICVLCRVHHACIMYTVQIVQCTMYMVYHVYQGAWVELALIQRVVPRG